MATQKEYQEYCRAKKEIHEKPLTKKQFEELNEIGSE